MAAPSSPSDSKQGAQDLTGATVGRFAIRARLGMGGMGEVYRADDSMLKRPVALKRMAAHLRADEHYRRRFLREAERASSLNNQHIAAVYDVLEESREIFLVMEFVEGTTLRQRLPGPVSIQECLEVVIQCAEGLAAAQEKGVVHCDIKPENIMLTPKGHVKVLDFGVAKRFPRSDQSTVTGSTDSKTSGFSGTPAYMAPEVLLEKESVERADIFSLGVVFYEMLSGQHPFLAGSFMATSDRILREEPAPLGQLNPQIPAELERIVARMLAKDPAQRYATARELLADLRGLAAQPTPSEPTPRQVRRWYQRRAFWAPVALAALIGIALWLWPTRPSFEGRGWVLIADFENRTGEAVFDHTLQEALAITLEQSRHLSLFPRTQLQEVLRRMKREGTQRIDEALGREICIRENLQVLVGGIIAKIGEDYVLTLRATDPDGRALFSGKEIANGQKAVLPTLDRLASGLRKQLGESLEAIRETADPLERVTSISLEAIRYFSLGKKQVYAGKHREAEKLMQRAVELDPEFAMAYAYLALMQIRLKDRPQEGRKNLQRAFELSSHLTERERLKISGDYNLWVTGDVAQAIDRYRVLLDRYPDDHGGRNNLALAYGRAGEFQSAVQELEIVVRQLGTPPSHHNLASFQFLAGRVERAIEIEEKYLAAHPEATYPLYNLGLFHLVRGDVNSAAEYFRRLEAAGGGGTSDLHRALEDLHLTEGRYGLAWDELRKDLQLRLKAGDVVGEAGTRLRMASFFLEQKDRLRARQEALRAVALTQETELLALGGSLLAQAGDLAGARGIVGKLRAAGGESWNALVQGELLLASGDAVSALHRFQESAGLRVSTLTVEAQARAYRSAGRLSDAVGAYQQVLARQGERAITEPDGPAVHRVVQTYYRLGVLYQELGDASQAQKNLERFSHYWRNPDAEAPFVSDARQRLQSLRGASQK